VQEWEKKRKYLDACLAQHRHFTPFVVSTDGLVNREAKELLKQLALWLTDKWEHPYSVVHGFVNTCMSIAIVRATHFVCKDHTSQPSRSVDASNGKIAPVLGCFTPTTTTKKYQLIHTQHSHWPINPDIPTPTKRRTLLIWTPSTHPVAITQAVLIRVNVNIVSPRFVCWVDII
jgi:hypothetical protein